MTKLPPSTYCPARCPVQPRAGYLSPPGVQGFDWRFVARNTWWRALAVGVWGNSGFLVLKSNEIQKQWRLLNLVSSMNSQVRKSSLIYWTANWVEAVFDAAAMKSALAESGRYQCSQSLFKCDLLFNPDPSVNNSVDCSNISSILNKNTFNLTLSIEVPLRQKSVNDLGQRYYEAPARLHGKLTLAVSADWHLTCDPLKAKPVSPAENIIAFLLPLSPKIVSVLIASSRKSLRIKWASFSSVDCFNQLPLMGTNATPSSRSMFRDNRDEEKLAKWKKFALSESCLKFELMYSWGLGGNLSL